MGTPRVTEEFHNPDRTFGRGGRTGRVGTEEQPDQTGSTFRGPGVKPGTGVDMNAVTTTVGGWSPNSSPGWDSGPRSGR